MVKEIAHVNQLNKISQSDWEETSKKIVNNSLSCYTLQQQKIMACLDLLNLALLTIST